MQSNYILLLRNSNAFKNLMQCFFYFVEYELLKSPQLSAMQEFLFILKFNLWIIDVIKYFLHKIYSYVYNNGG